MKSVISANIPTHLAEKLKGKTRGTRSKIVERALDAYLKGESDFTIVDIDTRRLAVELMSRLQRENNWNHTPLTMMLLELIES